MDQVPTLIAVLIALTALALAYSSVPKVRKLEKRVEDLERKLSA